MSSLSAHFTTLASLQAENALRRSRVQAQLATRGVNQVINKSRDQRISPYIRAHEIEHERITAIHNRHQLDDSVRRADQRHLENISRRQKLMADLAHVRRQTQAHYRHQKEKNMILSEQQVCQKILYNNLKQEEYDYSQSKKNMYTEDKIQSQIYKNLIHRYV